MTKYSPEFKIQIIKEYWYGNTGCGKLAKKYSISKRMVCRWIQTYRLQGKVRSSHRKRRFSAEFKFNVVDYYQNHEESMEQVAAKFDLLASQVSLWRSALLRYGYEALKPHRKGRPPKMKRSQKQLRRLAEQSENQRLKAELAKVKAELYDTKMERDILKKSLTLFGPSKHVKKRKS